MFDGEALVEPGVKDTWLWQRLVREPVDPVPLRALLLAAPRQCAHPEHHDVVAERRQGIEVSRHRVIGKKARHPAAATVPGSGSDRASGAEAPSLTSLTLARLRSLRVPRKSRNLPRRDRPQIWVKPRKSNVSGLPSPARSRSSAAELDQTGLVRMQGQRKLRQPIPQLRLKPLGIGLVFKAGDDVIGIARQDDVPLGMVASPPRSPRIEDVVQVDVRQQGRGNAALRRPYLWPGHRLPSPGSGAN
jgi:hypothetical protein